MALSSAASDIPISGPEQISAESAEESIQPLRSFLSERFTIAIQEEPCSAAFDDSPEHRRGFGVRVKGIDAKKRERVVEEERHRDRTLPI
jgi:hypothetical protein